MKVITMMGEIPFADLEEMAREKAKDNIEQWGYQPLPLLLLAFYEEMGEFTQAYLEYYYENGQYTRLYEEWLDLWALVYQIHHAIAAGEYNEDMLNQCGYEKLNNEIN